MKMWISSLPIRLKLLEEGAQGYMILCFLEVKGDLDLKCVDVVMEFLEVFPEDVTSLSL